MSIILSKQPPLIILRGVYKNLIKVGYIFLQKFPDELELAKITKDIEAIKLVINIHFTKDCY